jgi:hypothetical protein
MKKKNSKPAGGFATWNNPDIHSHAVFIPGPHHQGIGTAWWN